MIPRKSPLPSPQTDGAAPTGQAPFPLPTSKPSLAMPGVLPDVPTAGSLSIPSDGTHSITLPNPQLGTDLGKILADLSVFRAVSRKDAVDAAGYAALKARGMLTEGQNYAVVNQKGLQYLEDLVLPV